MQKNRRLLVACVVVALLLIAIGYAYYQYDKPRTTAAGSITDIGISAENLFSEFSKDEIQASGRYINKIIEVKGIVHEVDSGSGSLAVLLVTGSSGYINCSMANTSKNVHKNDELTIKGKCTGYLMDVFLVDCELK